MAKLKNQIIKEKVLVLNSDHLRHVREGVWRRVFPNEGGGGGIKKNNAELMHPRWLQKWAPLAFL